MINFQQFEDRYIYFVSLFIFHFKHILRILLHNNQPIIRASAGRRTNTSEVLSLLSEFHIRTLISSPMILDKVAMEAGSLGMLDYEGEYLTQEQREAEGAQVIKKRKIQNRRLNEIPGTGLRQHGRYRECQSPDRLSPTS